MSNTDTYCPEHLTSVLTCPHTFEKARIRRALDARPVGCVSRPMDRFAPFGRGSQTGARCAEREARAHEWRGWKGASMTAKDTSRIDEPGDNAPTRLRCIQVDKEGA